MLKLEHALWGTLTARFPGALAFTFALLLVVTRILSTIAQY